MDEIFLYDTTLRDGSQREGISFSVDDKVKIAQRLDEFGFHYIEGGWPGSNPKDAAFFLRARQLKLSRAKITAFGFTLKGRPAGRMPTCKPAFSQKRPVTLVGKSWDLRHRGAGPLSKRTWR
jgi:2-isopropylmalate synthase